MLAIHNLMGSDKGWCVCKFNSDLNLWALITPPSSFHDSLRFLVKIIEVLENDSK
jgi:hypothetical protein